MIGIGVQIHPSAYVDDTAEIGDHCRVRQFASVVRGARIGAHTSVGPGSMIDGSVIGEHCVISQNFGAGPGFLVGNRCFLGPNVVLSNDLWPAADKTGFDTARLLAHREWAIIIEDGVALGANSVILPGVRIGAGAMVGALTIVHHDVPPNTLITRDGQTMPITARMRSRRMRFVQAAGAREPA